jgi:peptidoglycan/xylan/chitin deacetylase (PgdA/CDA1 family)
LKKLLELAEIDIEEGYHIPSVTGSPFAVYKDVDEFFDKWKGRYDFLSEPTKRVLDMLDEFDVNATFFVVADVVEHYPGLVESIVERGHEIACHGLNHACKIDPKTKEPLMSVKEFEERTLEAKKMLERVCKDKVIRYRAPNALVGGWMLDSLEKIGFKYDSSISVNSLYNKTDSSLDGVSSHPYYTKKNGLEIGEEKGKNFVEFTWAYWNVFGFNFNFKIPTSGGPMLRFLGAHVILKGLNQSTKRGHTVFYFHQIDISNDKFPEVGKGRPLYWIVKGKK